MVFALHNGEPPYAITTVRRRLDLAVRIHACWPGTLGERWRCVWSTQGHGWVLHGCDWELKGGLCVPTLRLAWDQDPLVTPTLTQRQWVRVQHWLLGLFWRCFEVALFMDCLPSAGGPFFFLLVVPSPKDLALEHRPGLLLM